MTRRSRASARASAVCALLMPTLFIPPTPTSAADLQTTWYLANIGESCSAACFRNKGECNLKEMQRVATLRVTDPAFADKLKVQVRTT